MLDVAFFPALFKKAGPRISKFACPKEFTTRYPRYQVQTPEKFTGKKRPSKAGKANIPALKTIFSEKENEMAVKGVQTLDL